MKLIQFGSRVRLFGTLHSPRTFSVPRAAVVLCNPFGEEALRAHRIYRVLARKLAQNGVPALRFDYSGSGDSYGESSDATLPAWVEDAEAAVNELQKQTKASEFVLFGLRLGGTVASLAARNERVSRVVLWDPVIDGRAYLQELSDSHVRYMESELGRPQSLPPIGTIPREALGHPISDRLASDLLKIDLAQDEHPSNKLTLTVLWTGGTASAPQAYRRRIQNSTTKWLNIDSTTPWNSDAALNSAVVPMDVIEAIVASIPGTGDQQ